ncbi:F-box/LRR-repeat protein 17-like [Dendronephthya gigantea]|uniref:F-box/LRR-repeat protein 17-like n=1 Tax=Dendronephthya gigantea TaxID=151771 RepID=UPI001069832B|nr:F-box/LRR-repeat protein 17-like [Dendronephthya gigantea]
MSDDVLAALGECCHQLRKLDVTLSLNFTDEGIRKVCEGCPKLEELVIDQCSKLTNESLVHLGHHSAMLKYISATSIANITDQGVGALLPGCQQLQTLRLPMCSLSGQSAYHIAEYGADILYLDVRGAKLEDDHLCEIVNALKKLQTLNLGLCFELTDASVKEIALHCKDIKHLFLVNNKITDEGLLHLSVYSQDIVHLDVSWCHGVTADGARKVLNGCPKLKHLGLFRCDKVPDSAVSELCSQFPQVFISTLETEMKKSRCQKLDGKREKSGVEKLSVSSS